MADNTTLNSGAGGDTLRTDDVGGGIKIPVSKIHNGADGVDGGPITTSNPFATQSQSGSLTALLVGGVSSPVSFSNPLPISGSVGIKVGGVNVSRSNAVPVQPTSESSGQVLSGSTVRTVNYVATDVNASGSTQVIAPQGAGNMIRVLSLFAMASGSVVAKWQSTGSAGTIQNVSGYIPLAAGGGYVLPHNPHGWFQTRTNEGLNLSLNSAVNVGLNITWILA